MCFCVYVCAHTHISFVNDFCSFMNPSWPTLRLSHAHTKRERECVFARKTHTHTPPSEQETESRHKELATIAKRALIQGKSAKIDKTLIPARSFETDLAQLQVFGMAWGGKGGGLERM